MTPTEALEAFLRRALTRRVDRYAEFVNSAKRHGKFLEAIRHELAADLDDSCAVDELSDQALDRPAFLFSPPDEFGTELASLRVVAESQDDSRLAVARDGSAAILRPEAMVDDQMLFDFSG